MSEDRSKPPPGYSTLPDLPSYDPPRGTYSRADGVGDLHPGGDEEAIAACWAHRDAVLATREPSAGMRRLAARAVEARRKDDGSIEDGWAEGMAGLIIDGMGEDEPAPTTSTIELRVRTDHSARSLAGLVCTIDPRDTDKRELVRRAIVAFRELLSDAEGELEAVDRMEKFLDDDLWMRQSVFTSEHPPKP